MSSSEATRRASSTALSEQHPPCFADSSVSPRGHCCSVTPTTSWPWACRSAAATDESTPPDIATATLTCATLRCGGGSSPRPPPLPTCRYTSPSPPPPPPPTTRPAPLATPPPPPQ